MKRKKGTQEETRVEATKVEDTGNEQYVLQHKITKRYVVNLEPKWTYTTDINKARRFDTKSGSEDLDELERLYGGGGNADYDDIEEHHTTIFLPLKRPGKKTVKKTWVALAEDLRARGK